MNAAAFVLLCCASVSAMQGSPGHLVAQRLGAPVVNVAQAGRTLSGVVVSDAQINGAALFVGIDWGFWYKDCEEGLAALDHLFAVRGNRPMVLATIPWHHGCADLINPVLLARCKDACILVRLEGSLTPPALHPGPEYLRRVADEVLKKK